MLCFHEAPSRILISTAQPNKVAAIAAKYGVEALMAGVTIEKGIEIRQRAMTLGSWEISSLKSAYSQALETYVR
jgi:phosphoribosylformylglycinamidine synthase